MAQKHLGHVLLRVRSSTPATSLIGCVSVAECNYARTLYRTSSRACCSSASSLSGRIAASHPGPQCFRNSITSSTPLLTGPSRPPRIVYSARSWSQTMLQNRPERRKFDTPTSFWDHHLAYPESPSASEHSGTLTLLCDAKTDGSFLVHHFLSFYLKANCKVCFVALIQSFSHYNIVGQKLGVSLSTARERGQLVFLEGLKSSIDIFFQTQEEPHPLQFFREANGGNLQSLYEFVRDALKPRDSEETMWRYPVLLVDNLSVLLSLGVGAVTVLDFIQYCRAAVCCELKGNIVALVHDSGDAEDEENDILLNGLSHQSHLILRAEGLATGFCKDVHGQLRILWRRPLQPTAQRDRSLTYQYKIQDKNVFFFAKGMSPAVL
ncbi:elongator complex protein 6 isoform X1 [Nannospalax galili]|uniref:elongator complex protein 6 isoform X1 n=1 Tax=Nannospalax galili TaxID=1026970 RepID=UPI00111C47D1|nr:elongator complex protein 6 isoform X1 [Nannospalax galili]